MNPDDILVDTDNNPLVASFDRPLWWVGLFRNYLDDHEGTWEAVWERWDGHACRVYRRTAVGAVVALVRGRLRHPRAPR